MLMTALDALQPRGFKNTALRSLHLTFIPFPSIHFQQLVSLFSFVSPMLFFLCPLYFLSQFPFWKTSILSPSVFFNLQLTCFLSPFLSSILPIAPSSHLSPAVIPSASLRPQALHRAQGEQRVITNCPSSCISLSLIRTLSDRQEALKCALRLLRELRWGK